MVRHFEELVQVPVDLRLERRPQLRGKWASDPINVYRTSNSLWNELCSLYAAAPLVPLIVAQNVGKQRLPRTPEPQAIMEQLPNVADYDRALETQLSIAYSIGLQFIYQYLPDSRNSGRALDLACGTGHFTRELGKRFRFDEVLGIDLSQPMVRSAQATAATRGPSNVLFRVGDATELADIPDNSVNLCCFNQAAHHMRDLEHVAQVLAEADRVTHPDGVVLMTDLLRLRTRRITEAYVRWITADYQSRGMAMIGSDFRNSMYAAWTLKELMTINPSPKKRRWTWHQSAGLKAFGLVLGCQSAEKLRTAPEWGASLVPDEYVDQLKLAQRLIKLIR